MELGQTDVPENNYHDCTDVVWIENEIGLPD